MKKIGLLLLVVSIIAGCGKKEGCIDNTATNYDAEAEKNDGSCIYPSTTATTATGSTDSISTGGTTGGTNTGGGVDTININTCVGNTINIADVSVKVNYVTKLNEFNEGDYNEIDFSKGGAFIKISLPKATKWNVVLSNTQLQKKVYSGEGKDISLQWYGNVDSIVNNEFLFKSGKVKLELIVSCMDLISKEFSVTGVQDFTEVREDFGFVIRDWDKNGVYPVTSNSYSPADGWSGGNGDFSVNYSSEQPSPIGGYYLNMYSKNSEASWYLGATVLPLPNFNALYQNDNEEAFINMFVKGNDKLISNNLEIGFKNNDGKSYFITNPINWSGWRLISFKLSEAYAHSGPNAGEKLTNIESINEIILQLGANPVKSDELQVYYDFIFLSYGRPLSNSNVLAN